MTGHAHLRPGLIGVVALGGALGSTARYELGRAVQPVDGWPLGTLLANLAGAFLLGAMLEALVRRGQESSGTRVIRLGLGTGVLGGFTTFSSLALELARLLAAGSAATALGYASLTLVLGFGACLAGVVLAARHHAWRYAGAAIDVADSSGGTSGAAR